MSSVANENIRRVLAMTREMLALADDGDRDRHDKGCGILYGILRDAAYRLRQEAEEERRRHQERGAWD